MKRLEGKTCLVTAAGQGIGRASAERMAAEGGRVIATDINDASLAELNAIDGIEARKLDVTNKAEIEALVADIGGVDVLFNCAGIVHNGTILDATEEEWDFAFDLNVKSQFRMIRAVLPHMIEKGSGSIINMSSVAGPVTGPVNRLIYSASKAAVAGMTRAVANDHVKQGIRCNAIAPGTVDSPSLHDRLRATGDYEGALKTFIGRQPMGRIGKPEEIAALVTYLAADESGFTTGVVHVVDGGWTA
ncbi:SDR family oxidoreductase [Thalassospira lucentensis]|uniref:SDR family oxidoreductase n=1 Tax=Thalassospira lucentensis TaxID=168935 RepID=UPI003D2EF4C4